MQKRKRETVADTAHIAPSSSAETDRTAHAGEGATVAQPPTGRRLAGGREGLRVGHGNVISYAGKNHGSSFCGGYSKKNDLNQW